MDAVLQKQAEALFLQHYQEWCLLAFSYVKNKAEAEDVVQDVFLSVLSQDSQKTIVHLKRYLTVCVRNAALKKIRGTRLHLSFNGREVPVPSHEIALMNIERKTLLEKSILALPEQRRKVFELCVLKGLTYKTVAAMTGISVNTVKYHLKRSYKSLRFTLRNAYFLALSVSIFHFFE